MAKYNGTNCARVPVPELLEQRNQAEKLPSDLKDLLIEALQLRLGHDKSKKSRVKADDPQMIDLEARLRSSLETHQDSIRDMTVGIEESQEVFVQQIMDRIKSLSRCSATANSELNDDLAKNVKLVSLDIDRTKVHNLLNTYNESGFLKEFFSSVLSSSTSDSHAEDNDINMVAATEGGNNTGNGAPFPLPNFIEKTHVTLAFAGEKEPAEALVAKFQHLQGQEVPVTVTGFLWSSTHAALAISVGTSTCSTNDSEPVSIPPCENSFPHVTVWCAPNNKAFQSNELPVLVESGKAFHVEFDKSMILVGNISFWNHCNEPIRL